MEYYLSFTSCVLLAVVWSSWSEAAPASTANQQADGPDDVRWRIVSGLETAYVYAEKLNEQINACDRQPLLRASAELQSILTGVCELLEVQQLAKKVENESDLNSILQENVLDTCHWLNLLVANEEISASPRFLQINDTCEVGHTPRLSRYCLEQKLGSDSFYKNIYLPASDFYANNVVNQDIPLWLNNSLSEEHDSILSTLQQTISCSSS